jgi:hypothetical protein
VSFPASTLTPLTDAQAREAEDTAMWLSDMIRRANHRNRHSIISIKAVDTLRFNAQGRMRRMARRHPEMSAFSHVIVNWSDSPAFYRWLLRERLDRIAVWARVYPVERHLARWSKA